MPSLSFFRPETWPQISQLGQMPEHMLMSGLQFMFNGSHRQCSAIETQHTVKKTLKGEVTNKKGRRAVAGSRLSPERHFAQKS